MMSIEKKNKIWDLLVAEAGAAEEWREQFLSAFPECKEFRFQGKFGFGGKIHAAEYREAGKVYVECYREDDTPELDALKADLNKKLLKIIKDIQ